MYGVLNRQRFDWLCECARVTLQLYLITGHCRKDIEAAHLNVTATEGLDIAGMTKSMTKAWQERIEDIEVGMSRGEGWFVCCLMYQNANSEPALFSINNLMSVY